MTVDLFSNFYKRENSTKRPSATDNKVTITGHLKEPCSVLHPVISFQSPPDASFPPDFFRYAYIPLFSRYYWVDDWVWNNGLWEIHLDVDVLATYRNDIGEETEYVLRTDSDTSDFNGAISDSAYPATTDFSITQVGFRNPFTPPDEIAQGTYIVGIINGDVTNSVGAITYYAMTATQFGTLKDTLFSNDGLESMDLGETIAGVFTWDSADMSEQIFKTMYNPYQYIASCMWFPIDIGNISGDSVSPIKVGWWDFNISGKRLSSTIGGFNDGVEMLPVHPQVTRGKYLNYAPYTKYTLYGKFGSIPIDTSYLEIGSYMVNYYTVDYITGQCLFQVFVAEDSSGVRRKLINKTEFMLGVPIQIAQIGRDYLGMTVNAIEAGKSAMTGAMMGGAVAGVSGAVIGALASSGGAIYNTIDSAMPQLQTSGINGSFIETELSTILIAIHYVICDEDIHHKGRPLCEMRQIKTLNGFVLCAEGDIELNAYDSERREVTRFLTTGFFWE